MVSSGSRAMIAIVSLASLVLVSVLAPSMLIFSFELPGSDSTGRTCGCLSLVYLS